jgi:hypothetical protein
MGASALEDAAAGGQGDLLGSEWTQVHPGKQG